MQRAVVRNALADLLNLAERGEIGLHEPGSFTDRAGRLNAAPGIAADDDHVEPLVVQATGDVESDAAGPSCDNCCAHVPALFCVG
ncbi:hypothetical protein OL239_02570 [Arthrobacter sp. ATA002]|nr:hypothetical protein [Arthrobacter sp. ATA002]WAP52209.1 hypothetical protein OL239_02570 [Arthrobacter sp. ATA002]